MNYLIDNWFYVGWIACGFVAYGVFKGKFLDLIKKNPDNDCSEDRITEELMCWIMALIGYAGLLIVFLLVFFTSYRFYWCLRMPRELTEKFWSDLESE